MQPHQICVSQLRIMLHIRTKYDLTNSGLQKPTETKFHLKNKFELDINLRFVHHSGFSCSPNLLINTSLTTVLRIAATPMGTAKSDDGIQIQWASVVHSRRGRCFCIYLVYSSKRKKNKL